MQYLRRVRWAGAVLRPLLCFTLGLILPTLQAGQTEAVPPSRLRVATYNLENYTSTGRMTPDGYRKDYPKPEEAKRALHQVILGMKADILVFQEMGSEGHLRELQRDLAALGDNYEHLIVLDAFDKERRLAALSKIPFLHIVPHAKIEFPYLKGKSVSKRGLLELGFATAAGELSLWVVHLKSRFSEEGTDPDSGILRNAEASALRDIVLTRHKDPSSEMFLILGDFNDTKKSRPLRAFQARGKTELAMLLPALDSRKEAWTHYYRQQDSYDRVDHILCSPGMKFRIQTPTTGGLPGATIIDQAETSKASDHRPLLVQLDLRPGAANGLPVSPE